MRRGTATALAALTLLAAAGCTQTQAEYTTPSELCGVPVDPAVLRPVLLPGEKLTTSTANSAEDLRRCAVFIDEDRILDLQTRPEPADKNYRGMWDYYMPDGTPVDIGDDGLATDIAVGAAARCSVKGEKRVFVAQAFRFYPKRDDATTRKEALVRFMTAYFPAAKKAAGCTG